MIYYNGGVKGCNSRHCVNHLCNDKEGRFGLLCYVTLWWCEINVIVPHMEREFSFILVHTDVVKNNIET